MTTFGLDAQCEEGQRQLMAGQYLEAIATLSEAERLVWEAKDYSLLSRLYLPLQEARRQARQRCGEGLMNLGLVARGPDDMLDPIAILAEIGQGQVLAAGWGSIEPALGVRRIARERKLYVEAFLGAVFPLIGGARAVVVVALEEDRLPDARPRSREELVKLLPARALVFAAEEFGGGSVRGSVETFARVCEIWERLHLPFLSAADAQIDLKGKMEGYRQTIRVDYACELAHQGLAAAAKEMGKVSGE
jgi:hypothetical protein